VIVVAIDIGGTFTDLIGFDQASGQFVQAKSLTTPAQLEQGVIDCIRKSGLAAAAIDELIHGSTIAINTLIERKGAKTGLVVTYCSIVTPFCLWTMSNYFLSMPPDLEEAARVDGCTRLGALVRVILPLAQPGVLTTAMFGFLLAWDEFLYSLIFTSTSNAKTIPVAIAEFTGKFSSDFGLIAAGGVLASLPPLLLALAFQRYIVGGLTSGAVKG